MKNKVIPTHFFASRLKKYLKKFPAFGKELLQLEQQLIAMPKQGTDLGAGLFKIRMASKSKGGGKSGGFRIITYVVEQNQEGGFNIFLITIYDKSEESSIDKSELQKLVKSILG